MANRVWHWLFGRGLVATPDNFGRLGEKPSIPNCSITSPAEFIADGWSVKKLVRYIVTSRTWQMSAKRRRARSTSIPRDALLSHARVRRLEAESIRDALLAVSGGLKPEPFGAERAGVLADAEVDTENQPKPGPLDGNGRRSLYLDVRRKFPSEFLAAFDFPRRRAPPAAATKPTSPRKASRCSTIPSCDQQARLCAERVCGRVDAEPRRAHRAHVSSLALARPPGAEESARALAFLERGDAAANESATRRLADLAHAIFNMKEFIFIR